VHPDEFRWLREQGEALGFGSVFSGPLVRSSYRADEQRHAASRSAARQSHAASSSASQATPSGRGAGAH
jgi:lipoate synthase